MSISMNQLRAFYRVADSQSLSKAADFLGVSQPSLSKQLQRLEQHYQVVLFFRGRHGMQLTEQGRALYEQVKGLDHIEQRAEALLNQIQGGQRRVLRLGIGSVQVMMPVVGAFHRQHPDIELELTVAGSDDLRTRLQEREFDIGILHTEQDDPEFRRLDLIRQSLELMVPVDHPVQEGMDVCFEHLQQEAFIFRADGSRTQRLVNDWLMRQQVSITPAFCFPSQESQREAVAAGLGIAFIFQGETPPDQRLRTVRVNHLQPPELHQSLLWSHSVADQPVVRAFIRFMISYYQTMYMGNSNSPEAME